MMTHAIETSVDQITMAETSDNVCVGLALAAPEFGPRKLYASLSGIGMIDGKFVALIWIPTD